MKFMLYCLPHTLNGPLPTHPSVTAHIIQKILMHQVHHIFLTVTHFITKYFKTIFINIIINVLGSNQAHGIRYKFCKIIIFALKLKFYHWHQKLSGYFPRRTGPLCSFSRKYLPNPQIRISLSVILSSNNGVSWEKGKKALSSAC